MFTVKRGPKSLKKALVLGQNKYMRLLKCRNMYIICGKSDTSIFKNVGEIVASLKAECEAFYSTDQIDFSIS